LRKLLLDTHIWLWILLTPERLSDRVKKEIEDSKNELWLSPISIWELLMLHEKRRVLPGEEIEAWISRAMRALPLREAALTFEVANEVWRQRLPHRDPADQFLAATAKIYELTLVTGDERLQNLRHVDVLPN
jgi:PIN domain nuclease of toxin-antitoxin system